MDDRSTRRTGAHRLPPPPPSPPRPRPRRRHPAARSRLVAGAISVLAFLGLGGAMAAQAVQAPTGQERATRSTTADDATGEDDVTSVPVFAAQPAAPVLGQSPTSTSSGS